MTDFGNNCIILTRVSTDAQDFKAQEEDLKRWAKTKGLNVIKNISTKESGFKSFNQKEGFTEVINFMSQNNCRIIICTALDRLARDKFVLEQIKEWLVKNKIQLYVKDFNFTLFNESGEVDFSTEIVFSVYAATAQLEMKTKKERFLRARIELKKQGYSIGSGKKILFGYSKVMTPGKILGKQRSMLIENPDDAEKVRQVFDWYLNGIDGDSTRCSTYAIVRESISRGYPKYLHSKRNVNKLLKEEAYTGSKNTSNFNKNPEYWRYGNKNAPRYVPANSYEIKYPPIISRELFDKVQEKMSGNDTHKDSANNEMADKSRFHVTILSKLIRCPQCGKFLCGEYLMKGTYLKCIYRCPTAKGGVKCNSTKTRLPMISIDAAVWAFCCKQYSEFREFLSKYNGQLDLNAYKLKIKNLEAKKKETEDKLQEYTLNYIETTKYISTPATKEKFELGAKAFQADIASLEKDIVKAKEELATYSNAGTMFTKVASTIQFVESEKSEIKKFVHQIIEEIHPVYHDRTNIVLEIKVKKGIRQLVTDELDGISRRTFLVVNTRDTNRPKARFCTTDCSFEDDGFHFSDGAVFGLSDVFATYYDELNDLDGETYITELDDERYFSILDVNKLDVYKKQDIPKNRQLQKN